MADVIKTVGDLRTDVECGQKENCAWMLARVLALFVGMVGAESFFLHGNALVMPPAAQPAPIIVQTMPPPVAARD